MARESRIESLPDASAATRIALVANADSGSADPRACAERLRAFGAHVERYELDQLERAAASGAERLAIAGGDGSIGAAAAAAAANGVPLAVIPSGTANDFARRLGLPQDRAAACRLAVRGTRLRELDLGWAAPAADAARERPFVNVASAGLPAPAARRAASWKQPLGALAYAAGALVAGVREHPVRCRIHCDEGVLYAGRAWQVTVACSGAFGAGSELDEADPEDGLLDVVAVAAGSRTLLLGMAVRLRRGDLSEHRAARHARCRTAELDGPPDTDYNVDGEVVRLGSARFRVEPAAYRLVVA